MRARTPALLLARDAESVLRRTMVQLGLVVEAAERDDADLLVRVADGAPIALDVKALAIPTLDRVRALHSRKTGALPVVVADQISAPIRDALNDAGIGWLDRRGHLRLVAPGILLDTDVAAVPRGRAASSKTVPIAGRSGLAAAAALLMRPDDPIGVSEIAHIADLNRSSVTRALASIADAHLAERTGRGRYRPLVPELFWALADVWPRDQVTMTLWHDADQLARRGFVAAGVPAAVAWGAPLAATVDYPVHWYAPSSEAVDDAVFRRSSEAAVEVVLSVDPIGLVTTEQYRVPGAELALAHPLFCALDLTQSARDRAALEEWSPPPEFARVW